jgi:hypothetical protein
MDGGSQYTPVPGQMSKSDASQCSASSQSQHKNPPWRNGSPSIHSQTPTYPTDDSNTPRLPPSRIHELSESEDDPKHKLDRAKRIRLESHVILTKPADRFRDRTTRRNAALELAQEIDDELLLDPMQSQVSSEPPPESSSPHVFVHYHRDSDVQRLITLGTNELAAKQARRVLFSALHGLMGYCPPWDRGTSNDTYSSRKEVLLENTELLMDNGIDVTSETILNILAGHGFRSNHAAIHSQYVYLVAANLLKTEHKVQDENIKKLLLSVFTFITGHRSYDDALNPMDRRIIDDTGVEEDYEYGIFY